MAEKNYWIADYSHMSLILKPDDSHYGLAGDYRYCHHYFLWPGSEKNRNRCWKATGDTVCFGERKAIGSNSYSLCNETSVVRRLTSNPRFDRLAREMSRFVNQYCR